MPDPKKTSLAGEADKAIGALEKFSGLVSTIVRVATPDYEACSRDLEEICKLILDGTENVVRWMNRFRDFDFWQEKAEANFRNLAGEYRELKTGRRYQELKFDCREIENIYNRNINGRIRRLFGGEKFDEAQQIFNKFCTADAWMVKLVHTEIFESLDNACQEFEKALDLPSIESAEEARLRYKLASNDLYQRIQNLGNQLTGNVLHFKARAAN